MLQPFQIRWLPGTGRDTAPCLPRRCLSHRVALSPLCLSAQLPLAPLPFHGDAPPLRAPLIVSLPLCCPASPLPCLTVPLPPRSRFVGNSGTLRALGPGRRDTGRSRDGFLSFRPRRRDRCVIVRKEPRAQLASTSRDCSAAPRSARVNVGRPARQPASPRPLRWKFRHSG